MRRRAHRVRNLVAAALGNVWAIVPQKLDAICELLSVRASGYEYEPAEISARIGPPPGPRSTPSAAAPARVAVLSIQGTIVPRAADATRVSGGGLVSAEQIGQALAAAVADPSITAIVLDMATPGGTVAGVPELAAQVRSAAKQKTVIAVANQLMASAGYWIASQAGQIVASPSADVGSIGVLAIHQETSKADAESGVTTTVFRSVPFKADINSVEPLTESARVHIERQLADVHQQFVAAVADGRGVTPAVVATQFGQGRTVSAAEALAAGMVDRIATLDQVLAELLTSENTGSGAPPRAGGNSLGATAARPAVSLMECSTMDPRLLTALIRIGAIDVSASAEQAQAALSAVLGMRGCKAGATVDEQLAALSATAGVLVAAVPPALTPPPPPAAPAPAAAAGIGAADITAMVRIAPLTPAAQMDLLAELAPQAGTITTAQVISRINSVSAAANPPAGPRVEITRDSRDNLVTAARDAILVRAWEHNLPAQIWDSRTQEEVDWRPAARHATALRRLPALARRCMIEGGVPAIAVDNLEDSQIARLVMGANPQEFGLQANEGMYNVTGMFSNILYDAANVMLRRSYAEANTTFDAWMKRAADINDFRTVHRVIGGELPDPQAVPENGEFSETTIADGRESYKLDVWGERFSIAWQTILNDQLGAFTEIPMKQGRAMRRKQNRLAYQVLKDNPTMSDTGALFNSTAVTSTGGHANLTSGAGSPSVATLNSLYSKMAQAPGLNTGVFLGLEPAYIIAPPALRGTVLNLLQSNADPASNNANSRNIWENNLKPVIDVELSAASTSGSDTAWYLASDWRDCDTIEYAYLSGMASPAFDSQPDFRRLGIAFRVYIAFAVKAIDWRGLQRHAGA